MATSTQRGCKKCGARCHGRMCRECERMDSQEGNDPTGQDYECPDCGGTTSGQGVTCFKCRGDN